MIHPMKPKERGERTRLLRLIREYRQEDTEGRGRLIDRLARKKDIAALSALAHTPDRMLRAACIRALSDPALFPERIARKTLILGLSDPSSGVRQAAAHGLLKTDDPEILPPVAEAWLLEDDPEVTVAILSDLTTKGQTAGGAMGQFWIDHPYVLEAAIQLLGTKDIHVRLRAVTLAGLVGMPRCVPVLIAALRDASPRVKHQAHQLLTSMTGEDLPEDWGEWVAWDAHRRPYGVDGQLM